MQPHSPQEFDNTLKALFGKEAKEMLPWLLPAMRGANAPMLLRALYEMQECYTRQQFGHHLIRFRRTDQLLVLPDEVSVRKLLNPPPI